MENKNIKILIIDDILDNIITLQALIEEAFPETSIFPALNGLQGLEMARKEDPDVIFLDIVMPGMDGFEVCQKLKKDKDLGEIPVVFVTALKGDKESRIRALESGAEAFLAKPIDRYELTAQIQAMVKIRNASKYRRDENKRLAELVLKKTQELMIENQARQESEEKFKYVFENSLIGKSLTLPSGELQVNKAMCAMLGYSENELKNKKWQEITHPDDIEFSEKQTAEIISGKIDSMRLTKRYIKKDGAILWADLQASLRRDPDGKPLYFITSIIDITDRMIAQKSLQQSEEKYRLLMTQMIQGLAVHEIITDSDGQPVDYVFLDINDSYTKLVGVTREMCIGKRITEVMPTVEKYWIDNFGEVALTGEPNYYENYLEATGKYYGTYTYSPKKGQFAVLVSDITEYKKYQEKLLYMSYHDQLTGLYNRRFFEEELNRRDTTANLPLTIIMCDINGLKIINDSFGHTIGDEYLKSTAEIIKKACRTDDIVARLGGGEFAVILTNVDAAEALKIIEQIKAMISEKKFAAIDLSVSFGLATKASEQQSVLETVVSAENYMYTQKIYEHTSMRSKTIDFIMNTLFEKSDRESQHSKRVSAICEAIAAKMNFSNDEINQIRVAGLVHDIGKIGINEQILNKAGSLDHNEWTAIKKHPEAGWRILSTSNEFSKIAEFVLRHHERWDGSGYPQGLTGAEIPIEARIIAIADTYDAMTSERSYKKAFSRVDAINELKRCSGTNFDPEIVAVFVNQVMANHNNTAVWPGENNQIDRDVYNAN